MKTLYGPYAQILTMRDIPLKGPLQNEQLEVLVNAGILTSGEDIYKVGNFNQLRQEADLVNEVDQPSVAIPGMIDCHTHLIWGGSRAGDFEKRNSGYSYQKILEEGGGIYETVRMTRSASDEELMKSLIKRLEKQVASGVTTVEVKSGYGLSDKDEIRLLHLIKQVSNHVPPTLISTFLGAHVCPIDYNKEEYLTYLSYEVFPKIIAEQLSNRVDIFVEEEAFDVETAFPYLTKAKSQGFDLTIHANQFTAGGAYLAAKLGARSADHLEFIDDEEMQALATSDTMAVALPGASLGLGLPFAPARKLLDKGAGVAIATDWNPGSAPMGDLLTQASVLTTYEKLTTAEVFAGITVRGAHALGLSDRGTLVPGSKADWTAFKTNDYRDIMYHMGSLRPYATYISGDKVY